MGKNRLISVIAKRSMIVVCLLFTFCMKVPDAPGKVSAEVVYRFNGEIDMLKLFNLTATYTDAKNKPVTEKIARLPWNKSVKTSIPFEAHFEVNFGAKATPASMKYAAVGFGGDIAYNTSDGQTNLQSKQQGRQFEIEPRINYASDKDLIFSIVLPEGVSADDVNLYVAPLKYNKHFAFTYTADDAVVGSYARIWRRINQKWIDDEEFFHMGRTQTTGYVPENTLSMSDGCGNERRFGFGTAIWPTFRNPSNNNEPRMSETSVNSIYIAWCELRDMLDFGASVYLYNVDETKYDKQSIAEISQGFVDDYNKTYEKLKRRMKVLALPDGLQSYLDAGKTSNLVKFTRSSLSNELIYLKSCGSLYKKETSGGEHTSDIKSKLAELERQHLSDNPYWVAITSHRVGLDMMDFIATVYERYGLAGSDDIWAASWDEIYEYVEMREGSKITKSVNGQEVTFIVSLPNITDYYFRDLSFMLKGLNADLAVTPKSNNIVGLNHAKSGEDMLINVNFNPDLLMRAEKYTAQYEASVEKSDRDDAIYFVSQLLPELAQPFKQRINYRDDNSLILKGVSINGAGNTVYNQNIKISLETVGKPKYYRIAETADLSNVAWSAIVDGDIDYELSEGYDTKIIYVQLKSDQAVTETVSAQIKYAAVPETGTINRAAIEAYVAKYTGYKLIFNQKIDRK